MAERALQYKMPTDDKFISMSSWSDYKNGLLAAEMLKTDLHQLTLFQLKNDSRLQEIERKISLRRDIFSLEDGDILADNLSRDGSLEFSLEE